MLQSNLKWFRVVSLLALHWMSMVFCLGNTNQILKKTNDITLPLTSSIQDNTIATHRDVGCGTIVSNVTHVLFKNAQHPEPTYTKAICEIVIQRANPSISKLSLNFKRLELYRAKSDGQCVHDRFAVFTDLNSPVSPIICGNYSNKTLTIPFNPQSLIVSVTTSDLDHDRWWTVEIKQEK